MCSYTTEMNFSHGDTQVTKINTIIAGRSLTSIDCNIFFQLS